MKPRRLGKSLLTLAMLTLLSACPRKKEAIPEPPLPATTSVSSPDDCSTAHEDLRRIAQAIRENDNGRARDTLNQLLMRVNALSTGAGSSTAASPQLKKFPDDVTPDQMMSILMALNACTVRDMPSIATAIPRKDERLLRDRFNTAFGKPSLVVPFGVKLATLTTAVDKGALPLSSEHKKSFQELKARYEKIREHVEETANVEMNRKEKLPAFRYLDSELSEADSLRSQVLDILK